MTEEKLGVLEYGAMPFDSSYGHSINLVLMPSVKDVNNAALQHILGMADASLADLERIFDALHSTGLDYADLYFQSSRSESWYLEESMVKNGRFQLNSGVGVRAISGEKSALAYSGSMKLPYVKEAAKAVRSIVSHGGSNVAAITHVSPPPHIRYQNIDPLHSLDNAQKTALLHRLESMVRALDTRVVDVTATLSAQHDILLILNHQGRLSTDIRPQVRLNVTVILQNGNGRREQGVAGAGGRGGYEMFTYESLQSLARQAVHQAVVNMKAVPAPAGAMTVVLASGWPGILLHEAVGHGLEGDLNRRGSSVYSNSMGRRVASRNITVVDDGTLPGQRGSLSVDDEGNPGRRTVLIENGILRNYMQDVLNARLMNSRTTGNGRRQSYAHMPMPRMTNTFMMNGTTPPEEIIASVPRGIYAANFGGGQVDITSGKFVFSATEAYLIEQGRVTQPLKGAILMGHGPEVLMKVSMVGNNLALDPGIGTCGKDGQLVPVGVGQPTLKVDELTVGGTGEMSRQAVGSISSSFSQ